MQQWVPVLSPGYPHSPSSEMLAAQMLNTPYYTQGAPGAKAAAHQQDDRDDPPPPPIPEQRPSHAPHVPNTRPEAQTAGPHHQATASHGGEGNGEIKPTSFQLSPQGLIMQYDPEQLRQYSQQRNLSIYESTTPAPAVDTTPPVTLLPLRYGGHSPDLLNQKPRNDLLSTPGVMHEMLDRPTPGTVSYDTTPYGYGLDYRYGAAPTYANEMAAYYRRVDPQYVAYPTTPFTPMMMVPPPIPPMVAPSADIPIVARPGSHAAAVSSAYGVAPPGMHAHGHAASQGPGGRSGRGSKTRGVARRGEHGHQVQHASEHYPEANAHAAAQSPSHDQAYFPPQHQTYPSMARGEAYGGRQYLGQQRGE